MAFSCFGPFSCGQFDRGVKTKTAETIESSKYNYCVEALLTFPRDY